MGEGDLLAMVWLLWFEQAEALVVATDDDGHLFEAVPLVADLLDRVRDPQGSGDAAGALQVACTVDHEGLEKTETRGVALVDDIEAKGAGLTCHACRHAQITAAVEHGDADGSLQGRGRLRLRRPGRGLPLWKQSHTQKDDTGDTGQQPEGFFLHEYAGSEKTRGQKSAGSGGGWQAACHDMTPQGVLRWRRAPPKVNPYMVQASVGEGVLASDGQQAHADADEEIGRGDERQGTSKAVGQVGLGVHDGTLFR